MELRESDAAEGFVTTPFAAALASGKRCIQLVLLCVEPAAVGKADPLGAVDAMARLAHAHRDVGRYFAPGLHGYNGM